MKGNLWFIKLEKVREALISVTTGIIGQIMWSELGHSWVWVL